MKKLLAALVISLGIIGGTAEAVHAHQETAVAQDDGGNGEDDDSGLLGLIGLAGLLGLGGLARRDRRDHDRDRDRYRERPPGSVR
jgi:hypothetical protein